VVRKDEHRVHREYENHESCPAPQKHFGAAGLPSLVSRTGLFAIVGLLLLAVRSFLIGVPSLSLRLILFLGRETTADIKRTHFQPYFRRGS